MVARFKTCPTGTIHSPKNPGHNDTSDFRIPAVIAMMYGAFKLVIGVKFLTETIAKIFDYVYLPFILWLSDILGGEGFCIHCL